MGFADSVSGLASPKSSVAVIAALVPVGYAVYLNWTVNRATTATAGILTDASQIAAPKSIPDEVKFDRSQWVVAYERIMSTPVDAAALPAPDDTPSPSAHLRAYCRAAHKAFSWTPQAFIIRFMLREPLNRQSFDTSWIDQLSFQPGDIVNGVYKVSHFSKDETSERIELVMETPPSYKGPPVHGIILSAVEVDDEANAAVFVNETWMWRRQTEPPVLLETPFGAWFHRLLGGWLIMKGLASLEVTGRRNSKDR